MASTAEGPAGRLAEGPDDVLPADRTWTLLTGDVLDVRADADGRVGASVRERSGPFRSVRTPEGDPYVIPLSVTSLLAEHLDMELLNVGCRGGCVRVGYEQMGFGPYTYRSTTAWTFLSAAAGLLPLPRDRALTIARVGFTILIGSQQLGLHIDRARLADALAEYRQWVATVLTTPPG